MTARWFCCLGVCLALGGSVVRPALADDSDPARARVLFDAARLLVKSGDYAEACPKFEQSLALDPGIGTEFNLADCLEHVGRTDRARGWFLDVAERAHAAGQTDREQVASERAAALAPEPLSREPTPSVAVLPEVVVVATEPDASAKAELERRCAEAPQVVLNQEYGSLAEAAAGVRAARDSAALLARSAPQDVRLRKAERELARLEMDLADAWSLAGRVANQLALWAPATRKNISRPAAGAKVSLAPVTSERPAAQASR